MPRRLPAPCEEARRRLAEARREEAEADAEYHRERVRNVLSRRFQEANRRSLAATEARRRAEAEVTRICGEDTALILDLPGGTHVRVEVLVDPDQQRAFEEIIRDKIPPGDLEGLDWIRLRGRPSPDEHEVTIEGSDPPRKRRFRPAGTYSGGGADADERSQVIDDWYPPDVDTIKHEIGHHVYHHKLTDAQRRAWREFWTQNKGKMPTDYARVTNGEGFSEVYEYLRDEKELDEAVLELMLTLVAPNVSGDDDDSGGDDD